MRNNHAEGNRKLLINLSVSTYVFRLMEIEKVLRSL